MKFCLYCNKEVEDDAPACPSCGCSTFEKSNPVTAHDDDISIQLCSASILFPIFGLIYWIVKHRQTPKKARACLISGIISWLIAVAVCFIFVYFIFRGSM